MLVDQSFDDPGGIADIPFCGKKRMLPLLKNDPHMVVLFVLENPVINDDVSSVRSKSLRPFMVFDPPIANGELLPTKACRQMAGPAFPGPVRDLESRFPATIIHKRRAP